MDQQSEALLNRVRAKSLGDLTEYDKAVLRARATYLGKRDREKYQEVLQAKPVKQEESSVSQEGKAETQENLNTFPGQQEDIEEDEPEE